ncbi:hypothetical protein ASF22_02630 [Methylobacterium sp. Leaf87]|uniref:hypothetical protein n=1 Tax=Methylobacterium sp. Leaf87 TaxID=1736243 RepID=UPI0007006A0A|nr:hypothetical protein [Methylobacterium sp. Leaf87]KQO69523.1 hypothetical protein ASF22_02630 [Methylobacterium sp. Leaf87]
MIRPDPDQLADRLEKEITGGAFLLIGPEEVALCVAALRFYAPWASKQPAGAVEQPTLRTPDTARPVHPKLAEVLDSYGAAGRVAE